MARTIRKFKKQAGFIVSIELLLLSAILVVGLIVGMTNLRDSVLAELSDLSESIGAIDQSYSIAGVENLAGTAGTAGSKFNDAADTAGAAAKKIDTEIGDAGAAGGDLQFIANASGNPASEIGGNVTP